MRTYTVLNREVLRGIPVVMDESQPFVELIPGFSLPVMGALRAYDVPIDQAALITPAQELGITHVIEDERVGGEAGIIYSAAEGCGSTHAQAPHEEIVLVTPSVTEMGAAMVLWVLPPLPESGCFLWEGRTEIIVGAAGEQACGMPLKIFPDQPFRLNFGEEDGCGGQLAIQYLESELIMWGALNRKNKSPEVVMLSERGAWNQLSRA